MNQFNKIHATGTAIIFLMIFNACRDPRPNHTGEIKEEKFSRITAPGSSKQYKTGDTVRFEIAMIDSSLVPDSITVLQNAVRLGSSRERSFTWDTRHEGTGQHNISIEVYINGKGKDVHSVRVNLLSDVQPQLYKYKVVRVFPHDVGSYTQGLIYHNNMIFEGTGQYKESKLRRLRLNNGEVLQEQRLEDRYFGEGIAIANNRIYQLTWNEKVGFIYDLASFKRLSTFNLPSNEGWGLTFDGISLILSDGTNRLFILDTATLATKQIIQVYDDTRAIPQLNELEYVDGKIYANVYQTDMIVIIDPTTGKVTGKIDCSNLLAQSEMDQTTDVLNGIAYLPQQKHFLITGKYWPKMFEVEFVKK